MTNKAKAMNSAWRSSARVLAAALALFAGAACAADAARVLSMKGISTLQRSGEFPRVLEPGGALSVQDVISVGPESHATVEFSDQTRLVLRPNTVLRVGDYSEIAPESLLLGLVKGGLRVVSGLIGKRNPDALRITTPTATIGIRGTEFDARVCEEDCAAGETPKPGPRTQAEAARVVDVRGILVASGGDGVARPLTAGSALYQEEALATGPRSYAVIAFRDGSRVTLEESAQLAVRKFDYVGTGPAQSSAHLQLFAGTAHVWTGRIAKARPEAYVFESPLGTVRPKGTGFSVTIGGCVGSVCGSASVSTNSEGGVSGSANVSTGDASASGQVSVDSNGPSASGEVQGGGTTAGGTLDSERMLQSGADRLANDRTRDMSTMAENVDNLRSARDQARDRVQGGLDQARGLGSQAGRDAQSAAGEFDPRQAAEKALQAAEVLAISLAGQPFVGTTLYTIATVEIGVARNILHTWDGEVALQTPSGEVSVTKGEAVSVSGGTVVFLPAPRENFGRTDVPRPDRVNVDPALFDNRPSGVEQGLYVWVRDGRVVLEKDGRSVEVPKGSAALAGAERIALLEYVPNFMRFDETPRPSAFSGAVPAPVSSGLALPGLRGEPSRTVQIVQVIPRRGANFFDRSDPTGQATVASRSGATSSSPSSPPSAPSAPPPGTVCGNTVFTDGLGNPFAAPPANAGLVISYPVPGGNATVAIPASSTWDSYTGATTVSSATFTSPTTTTIAIQIGCPSNVQTNRFALRFNSAAPGIPAVVCITRQALQAQNCDAQGN